MQTGRAVTSLAEVEETVRRDDPWGNAYRLIRVGDRYRVDSSGKDGRFGTSDDIRYPDPEWDR